MTNYRSYIDLTSIISKNILKIPQSIDLIVGVPRSGMIPAYMISGLLDCGVTDLHSFLRNDKVKGGHRYRNEERNAFDYNNILILDDSVNSGNAISEVKFLIQKSDLQNIDKLIFGAIYATPFSTQFVDIYFEIIPNPRFFEWNIYNHPTLANSCFDMDGVLCHDVPESYNDDGEKYIDYITNVRPLIKPRVKIDKIVTSRLEKYRRFTEEWLSKNGYEYNELIMLDLPDKKSRAKWAKYGEFKASVYNQSNNILFFESSFEQANDICRITGKPVFCVDTKQMINSDKEIIQSQIFSSYGKIRVLFSMIKWKFLKLFGIVRPLNKL